MIVAIAANFVFGVLLNFGVGNYAPSLAMLSLMGMDPRLAFRSWRRAGRWRAREGVRHFADRRGGSSHRLRLAIGGIPAVLIAAFLVKSMPVDILRWLISPWLCTPRPSCSAPPSPGRREHQDEGATAPVAG